MAITIVDDSGGSLIIAQLVANNNAFIAAQLATANSGTVAGCEQITLIV